MQRATAADAVYCALTAAQGSGDLAGGGGGHAVLGLAKLRRGTQLHGIDAGFGNQILPDVELLSDGEGVLKVSGTTELVSAGIAAARSGTRSC